MMILSCLADENIQTRFQLEKHIVFHHLIDHLVESSIVFRRMIDHLMESSVGNGAV